MIRHISFKAAILIFGTIIGLGVSFAKDLPGNTSDRVVDSQKALVESGLNSERSLEITHIMLENHFNEDQIITVHRIMVTSMVENLPIDPLTDKILEGVSKNIQPDRIVDALKMVQARQLFSLNLGKQLAGNASEARNLAEAYSASLAAGLTHEDAKVITGVLVQTTASPNSESAYDLSMATLKTARDMSRLGAHSNTLTDVISKALAQGFSASRMESMRQSFNAQAHQTQPDNLARSYARALDKGMSIGPSSSGNKANQEKSSRGNNAGQGGGQRGGNDPGIPGGDGAGSGSGNSGGSGGSSGGTGSGGSSGSGGSGSGSGSGNGSGGSPGGNGSGGSGSGQ